MPKAEYSRQLVIQTSWKSCSIKRDQNIGWNNQFLDQVNKLKRRVNGKTIGQYKQKERILINIKNREKRKRTCEYCQVRRLLKKFLE